MSPKVAQIMLKFCIFVGMLEDFITPKRDGDRLCGMEMNAGRPHFRMVAPEAISSQHSAQSQLGGLALLS